MSDCVKKISVWGDSVAKGVIYDDSRKRYALSPFIAMRELAGAINASISNHAKMGITVDAGLEILDRDLKKDAGTQIGIIEFGGNDCDYKWDEISANPSGEHLPRTPLPIFEEKIHCMINLLRTRGIIPVMMTLPPINADAYFDFIIQGSRSAANILKWLGDKNRIYRVHESYSLSLTKLAYSLGVKLIDVRSAFLTQSNTNSLICKDGIHPNAQGQRLIEQTVLSAF